MPKSIINETTQAITVKHERISNESSGSFWLEKNFSCDGICCICLPGILSLRVAVLMKILMSSRVILEDQELLTPPKIVVLASFKILTLDQFWRAYVSSHKEFLRERRQVFNEYLSPPQLVLFFHKEIIYYIQTLSKCPDEYPLYAREHQEKQTQVRLN